MTALLYFVVALLATGLATRAWLAARGEPARIAFLAYGWALGVAYLSFALSLLPGLDLLRLAYLFAGMWVPPTALWTVDHLFRREDGRPPSPQVARLLGATAVLAPLFTGLELFFYPYTPRSSGVEVVAGVMVAVGSVLVILRIWEAWRATSAKLDRTRLQYLIGVAAATVVFTMIEQVARILGPQPTAEAALSISTRVFLLQGPIPPFSALLALLVTWFLYQVLELYRLLDLQELMSRMAVLGVSGLLLVLVDGVTVLWVGTFTDYPVHTTFQVFLASVLFLAAYDPLRHQIHLAANRFLNQRGQQLQDAMLGLRAEIPSLISARGLAETLLARLHASGRVPSASVYLWDRSLDAFACVAVRGQGGQRPLAVVAPQPFTEPFTEGVRWFLAAEVQRRARVDAREAELARLMAAQGAGLTLPFVTSKGVVLGWVNLRDEDWSDGFTADELQGLAEIADLAAVALANISEFQALEEAHRLSALGAMAAGLAHEIRNPLAGIKGAAQFLQGEVGLSPDAQEMLDVVVVEADRLNVVVSQFLDYARPMNLQLDLTPLNALVSQALALVRAQGVPAGVRLEEQLDPDLPLVPLDPGRVRQVLLNLVQNGIQAMPEGGTLTLSTHRRQAPGRAPSVEVRVADTGRGVPLDVQDKLFVPFFTTKEHGTGLGLAISQRIVQRHGGEIELQSEPGAGAVFSVRLPIPDDGT